MVIIAQQTARSTVRLSYGMQYHSKRKYGLTVDVHTSDIYICRYWYIYLGTKHDTKYECVDTVECIYIYTIRYRPAVHIVYKYRDIS